MSDQPDPVEVRVALACVLASEGFRSSPRLSRFLQYLVEASLNGSPLKEYSIGIDVFEKAASFEPRSDSTVRGEASKLRLKLRLYYETAGAGDPILIEIPKGAYSAAFRPRPRPPRQTSRWPIFAGLATVTVIGMIVWWATKSANPPQPSLRRMTNDVGLTAFPAVSPGGDLVAFASDRSGRGGMDLWIQPVGGGDARRLTEDAADEYDPNFSPDGSRIAFRSEREGGGIYTVPAMGGTASMVVARGHHPRYSPDGAWIAYSIGNLRMIASEPGSGQMFVVAASGGTPRPVQPEFLSAHHPIWSPDGRHLLFLGRAKNSKRLDLDWYVTPFAGGQAIKTGSLPELTRLELIPPVWPRVPVTPSAWAQDYLLFPGSWKDSTNLWKLPLSSRTFLASAPAQRLTFGSGSEVSASLTPAGDIVFADVSANHEIWSLPIDADRGEVKGAPERMTNNAAIDQWPTISRDGQKLVYLSFRTGNSEVWLKELDTGRETPLTTDGGSKDWPEIAPDGTSYSFARIGQQVVVWWAKFHDAPKQLCIDCMALTPLPDGTGFLSTGRSRPPQHPHIMDFSGHSTSWLWHPTWPLYQSQLSPDGVWVVFYASLSQETSRIYVARFRKDSPPQPAEWIPITAGEFLETTPLWSPDGNRLYFGSNRDDFQCIWTVALDPASKRPAGAPVPLAHFHNATQQMGNVGLTRRGMSVARDRIVFPLVERRGNLWFMQSR